MEVGAEGNINAPIRPAPVGMEEYLEVIQDALVTFFKVGYQKYYEVGGSDANIIQFINKTLKDNNAIIAGGFLLHAIHGYPILGGRPIDIDIYVPCKNLSRFNKTMLKLSDTLIIRQHNATAYCRSFLRMNGIRSVQGFFKPPAVRHGPKPHIMDIMAVRNARSPLDVVQNFDLTFCQIWYDGETVWATHPEHVRNKTGFLQKDYLPLLIRGNWFLKKRMQKYINRGFIIEPETNHISLTPDMVTKLMFRGDTDTKCNQIERNEAYYKKWYSRALFTFIIYNKYRVLQKTERDNQDILMNMASRPETDITISQAQLNKADADMDSLEPTDGYDSDDFSIDRKETYYPIVNKFSPGIIDDKRAVWLTQDEPTKLWKTIRQLITDFYFITPAISPFGVSPFYDRNQVELPTEQKVDLVYTMMEDADIGPGAFPRKFAPYADILKECSERLGTCAITLDDDVSVYDIHNHTLDQAVSVNGLKQHLDILIGQGDKRRLPCYVAGCTWNLSLDEIRAIVNRDYYDAFTKPIAVPLPPPDALLGTQGLGDNPGDAETKIDLIEILQNAPSDAGVWQNIYHHVMCPFCLSYISRDSGCTYVIHPNPGALPGALSPFCKPQNIIKDIRDKYEAAAAGEYLEVCAECGRPCVRHQHFDLNDPPGIEPQHLTATGNPDYARCAGGGRAEQIARIIAVRDAVPIGGDPANLRVVAGFAAEAAASDPALLARGAQVLAKVAATRTEANLNDGDGLGNNPLTAIVVEGGKRRIGKICSHGYETYKSKIRKTRRGRGKKSKVTRKN